MIPFLIRHPWLTLYAILHDVHVCWRCGRERVYHRTAYKWECPRCETLDRAGRRAGRDHALQLLRKARA